MREIKFRGKRYDNGEWAVGDFMRYSEEDAHITVDLIENETYQVKRDTVGQFTGLCDKNGKEIYEGDIVNNGHTVIYSGGTKRDFFQNGVVRYDVDNGCLVINNEDGNTNRITKKMIKGRKIAVLGNLHDNPDLLTNKAVNK